MQCEICHLNKASRAIKRTIDGATTELYVCDDCARKSASAPVSSDSIAGSLTDVLFSLGMPVGPDRKITDATCPVCGMTRSDIRARRRMGCPHCFSVFDTDLRTFLSEQVPAGMHSNESPVDAKVANTMDSLKQDLEKAIREDRFEDAAEISRKLHSLRSKTNKKSKDSEK